MKWNVPIAIPTRGGASVQKTFLSFPPELRKHVVFFAGTELVGEYENDVIITGLPIHKKRQMIHDYFTTDYVMVDDDVKFSVLRGKAYTPAAEIHDFEMFLDEAYSGPFGLFCSRMRAFSNVAKPRALGAPSKFVLHNKHETKDIRYDRYDQFEDISFYLECIHERKPLVLSQNLITINDFGDSGNKAARSSIIQDWITRYPGAVSATPGSSSLAGRQIDYKLRFNWSVSGKEKPSALDV